MTALLRFLLLILLAVGSIRPLTAAAILDAARMCRPSADDSSPCAPPPPIGERRGAETSAI